MSAIPEQNTRYVKSGSEHDQSEAGTGNANQAGSQALEQSIERWKMPPQAHSVVLGIVASWDACCFDRQSGKEVPLTCLPAASNPPFLQVRQSDKRFHCPSPNSNLLGIHELGHLPGFPVLQWSCHVAGAEKTHLGTRHPTPS